jgi:hypothetical protein
MSAEAPRSGPDKPTRLSRASRRQLLLWTLAPWIGIFFIGHQVLVGCRIPTIEGLVIHAFFTVIGSGGVLVGLVQAVLDPPKLVSVPIVLIPWAAMLITEMVFLRTRKIVYLLASEVLASLQFLCGMLFMIAIASV